MKYLVQIYQDEDGVFIAECPCIPGCVSQGRTAAEAEANIADAIRECLAVQAELGMPLTVETRDVEVMTAQTMPSTSPPPTNAWRFSAAT